MLLNSVLNVKAEIATFNNQEKALVGAFYVIYNFKHHEGSFEALEISENVTCFRCLSEPGPMPRPS